MILTGLARLGRDGVLRFLPDGTPVLNLALAYNWGEKDAGGKRATQWIDAALWGKRAEALAPHLTKGVAIDVVIEDVHIEMYESTGGGAAAKLVGRLINLEFACGTAKPEAQRAHPPIVSPASAAPAQAGGFDADDIPF